MKHFIVVYNMDTGFVEQTLEFPDIGGAFRQLALSKSVFAGKQYEIALVSDMSLASLKSNWKRWRWPEE